jgi:Ca2+/Na+ antiporter
MTIILYLLGILATFYVLYIVVDIFLIPTIYIIKDKIGLTDDQTGALTSFVSSAPELSVSMISLYLAIQSNDQAKFQEIAAIGPASVIGSALFSILFIVGASAWFGGKKLTWHSITRDMLYYIISVITLFFFIQDSTIMWYEGVILLLMYALYTIIVANWPKIHKFFNIPSTEIIAEDVVESEEKLLHIRDTDWTLKNFFAKLSSYIFFPLKNGFNALQVLYNVILAITLVVVSSGFMVEFAQKLALDLRIPASLIAVTILAAGTSVPDLLASIKTAREGYADTAVTNAVGSNVFDILGNLGLTYTISALFTKGLPVKVDVTQINTSIILLLASSIALVILLFAKKFNLSKLASVFLMVSYIVYLIFISYTTLYK